ncbi:hypothetical protein GOP47_0006099 [Adiantum capillus-veneris]|uniref:Mitochondrial splicing suppressor 51-like C-terminal domain-containing protein n=1 Tax=Adiantum capillus-veneris TaxID=13818 RepID=A0A9D4ZK02_ADICA|nr:hypothetical protein GOP47_0006099 [Adiantum capillus-veneris]
MKLGAVLHEFPFTFTHESTFLINKGILSTCSFFQSQGVHTVGAWSAECDCNQTTLSKSGLGTCASSSSSGWNLPSRMCPCTGVYKGAPQMETWSEYYIWRGLPLDSPVAILLHFPLTLYYSLHLVATKTFRNDMLTKRMLRIHYLGPSHELDQLEFFAELSVILQVEHIHIDLIGPDVPICRNFEELELIGLPQCSDGNCMCKLPSETEALKCRVTFKLWKGFYHDVYKQVAEGFPPDIIFAPNAGVAAFPSWIPTLELIYKLQVPSIFTDFCEEATMLALKCIQKVLDCELSIPMQINPFRQPMTPPCKVMELPTYSNCFLFGIN